MEKVDEVEDDKDEVVDDNDNDSNQNETPYYTSKTTVAIFLMLATGASALMASLGLTVWIAIISICASSVTSWSEFSGVQKKLNRCSSCPPGTKSAFSRSTAKNQCVLCTGHGTVNLDDYTCTCDILFSFSSDCTIPWSGSIITFVVGAIPLNNGKNDNNDSNDNNDNNGNNDTNRSAFRSIKYATQSISDGSILMMNVETVRNGRIRTTTGLNTKRTLSTPRTKNTMVVQASGIAQKKMKITRLLFLITSGNDSTSIIVERIVHVNPTAP